MPAVCHWKRFDLELACFANVLMNQNIRIEIRGIRRLLNDRA
jgi:hypothetical protein